MPSLTPTEVLPYWLPEVDEEREDTPRSVERARRKLVEEIWTIASTPAVLISEIGLDDKMFVVDATTFFEEKERSEEFPSPLPTDEPFREQESYVSVAEAENRNRLELLARQYVSKKLSREEEARLAIASERVRRLIPRVIPEDFEALQGILEDGERIESADIERRRRLGID